MSTAKECTVPRQLRCRSRTICYKDKLNTATKKSSSCVSLLAESYFISNEERIAVQKVMLEQVPELYEVITSVVCEYLKCQLRFPQAVDVVDERGKWMQATALCLSGDYVGIHYNGFGCEYDDWIHVRSPRLAPLNSHTRSADADREAVLSAINSEFGENTPASQFTLLLFDRIAKKSDALYNIRPANLAATVVKFTKAYFQPSMSNAYEWKPSSVELWQSAGGIMDSTAALDELQDQFERMFSPVNLCLPRPWYYSVCLNHYTLLHPDTRIEQHSRLFARRRCPRSFRLRIGEKQINKRKLHVKALTKIQRSKRPKTLCLPLT
jgi:hypothetical protein